MTKSSEIVGFFRRHMKQCHQEEKEKNPCKCSNCEKVCDIFPKIFFRKSFSVPVKYEPQFLHYQQITVHSGLLKYQREKSYHSYLFLVLKHGQVFAECPLREML